MNIVIVGGTSQVATELCMLLRHRGHDVYPTVRSQVGASFYNYHDVDYRIADITDRGDANTALADADVVVLAAFARQYSRGFAPRRARRTNDQLVQRTVDAAPSDSKIVYFSSIAAFGRDVGFSNWDSYGREKRHAENLLLDELNSQGKHGHAFRMGPVYGVNQDKTVQICRQIEQHQDSDGKLVAGVAPEKNSNVLHSVTLMDAIETVKKNSYENQVFTLVNEPRWTWKNVLEYYTPTETTIRYDPPGEPGFQDRLLQYGKQMVESKERALRGFSVYLPGRLNQRIFNEYVRRDVATDIGEPTTVEKLTMSQFDEDPAYGVRLPDLSPTDELIYFEEKIEPMFTSKYRPTVG